MFPAIKSAAGLVSAMSVSKSVVGAPLSASAIILYTLGLKFFSYRLTASSNNALTSGLKMDFLNFAAFSSKFLLHPSIAFFVSRILSLLPV